MPTRQGLVRRFFSRLGKAGPQASLPIATLALIVAVAGGVGAFAAVTTSQIANNAVTSAKIKNGQVKSADIENGGVKTADLAAGSVATSKLREGAVTASRLAAGAVSADKLAPGAVGAEQLADGAVTADKLAPGSIGTVVTYNRTHVQGAGTWNNWPTLACPSGTVLLNGYWAPDTPFGPGGWDLWQWYERYDFSEPSGAYRLQTKNLDAAPQGLTIYINCMTVPPDPTE